MLHFEIEGEKYEARVIYAQDDFIVAEINGLRRQFVIASKDERWFIHNDLLGDIELLELPRFPEVEAEKANGRYIAPMPGQVVKVLVQPGDSVKSGDGLVILNSMKMENTIEAFEEGIVEEVYVQEKGFVEADMVLLKMRE